jgi:hypothetical protein
MPKVHFIYPIPESGPQKYKAPRSIKTKEVVLNTGLELLVEAETNAQAEAVVNQLLDGENSTLDKMARAEVYVGVIFGKPIARFPIDLERSVAKAAMLEADAKEMSLSAKAQVLLRLLADMLLWAFSPLIVFVCVKWVWRGFRPIP